jgi:hypothetical protein
VPKSRKAITDVNDMKQWYFDLAEFKPKLDLNLILRDQKINYTNIFVK